jgi:hypothetical protein
MNTFYMPLPRKTGTPRGAVLAADLALLAGRTASAAFGWLRARWQDAAQARADAQRRSDAAALRHYAHQVMRHDARFAADLMAAADRHDAAVAGRRRR